MIDPADVHPLTDFQRNTKRHLARLKKTGKPAVLTVNGRAAAVLLDPAAYTRLAELAAKMDDIDAIRQGIADMDAGRWRTWKDVKRELKSRAGAGKKRKSA